MISYGDIATSAILFIYSIFLISASFWSFDVDFIFGAFLLMFGFFHLTIAIDDMHKTFEIDSKLRRLEHW